MNAPPSTGPSAAWFAFLVVAFAIVGLTGLFATFSAPLTLQRQIAREAALDDAAAAARKPDAGAALDALRARLDDSAPALLPPGAGAGAGPGPSDAASIDDRIARERTAMRARFAAENAATLTRLRWLVCLVTIMGAAFGVVVLRLSHRAA